MTVPENGRCLRDATTPYIRWRDATTPYICLRSVARDATAPYFPSSANQSRITFSAGLPLGVYP